MMTNDYTRDLHELATLVASPQDVEEVLGRALHALRDVVPYDLAAIFRLEGDTARVVAGAGPLMGPRVRRHELDLRKFPSIRRAMEARRPVAMTEHEHEHGEGDPYDGLLDLPAGHSCMVVPLFAGREDLGIVTLDRQVCESYPKSSVDLAGVYGQLISLALHFADQAQLLDRYRHQLKEHNRLLVEESGDCRAAVHWLEASHAPAMRDLVRLARQVAPADLPVLVLGETGTGKEVVSQAIHAWSPRVDGPFVKLNCSAIPENLVESELFGHVKGAFSGADRDRAGRFVTANGGTLLLDEIGDMPLSAQAKLLRVLQEGTFEPVGSDTPVKVDVRVIAATNVNLEAAVREKTFREDLYYRLAVFPLRIPPLRERPEDLEVIAIGFLGREAARRRGGPWRLSEAALSAMRASDWRGNVRALINALERATIVQPSGTIEPEHLGLGKATASPALSPTVAAPTLQLPSWKDNERTYLERLLERTDGKLYGDGGAAEIAELKPTTLRSKLVKHGLR
ncbi:MAG: sigma 54-interacting transcriptional regulator [Planctomycetota bacterium]|jgi:transcriptional regulator with GAF, ATPase, and Fis domain